MLLIQRWREINLPARHRREIDQQDSRIGGRRIGKMEEH